MGSNTITISDYNTNPTPASDEPVLLIDDEPEEYDDETHPDMKLPPG